APSPSRPPVGGSDPRALLPWRGGTPLTLLRAAPPPSPEPAVIVLGPGFVYIQRASTEFLAVQSFNGLFRFATVAHFDKAKAARASSLAICDHGHALDVAVGREKRL